jgi:diguanylate cyclase (GGDEF)-like protein
MARRLGVKREDILGKFCYQVLHGMPAPPDFCPQRRTIERGEESVREVYEKNLNGYFLLSSTPILDADGHLSAVVEVARDITDRKKIEEQLREAAITDDLTGLLNRRGFFAFSGQQQKTADRSGRPMSLLYLDVDNMKVINDQLGHDTGDQALRDTATILKKTFRTSDIIGRVGGDEFAVLLADQSRRDIEEIVKSNLRKNVEAHNESASRKYELSISMGMSRHDPEHPSSVEELVADADKMMYEDKKRRVGGRVIQ